MEKTAECLAQIEARIRAAEVCHNRDPGSVTLLAVSKTRPADVIRAAAAAGQRRFGESYLREALEKMDALADLDLEWHFIGPIQSNKTRGIAERFHWVHSVDRLKVARRLSEQRPETLPPLNVCLQVNISGEASKSGADPGDLPALARAVAALPRLRLRGLMAIPAPARSAGEEAVRALFRRLREALAALNRDGLALDTLSMGMSDDFEAAIAEGATLVRIGTDLFGARG
ncbi:MAG: YggS family pyridoxal phosphate-dependent enzyme [Gammaproteobacteria bacterium]|nr:YggS family pyridoxal phosphate-dependent enzyme [Gammaproteobacteria bacterium]